MELAWSLAEMNESAVIIPPVRIICWNMLFNKHLPFINHSSYSIVVSISPCGGDDACSIQATSRKWFRFFLVYGFFGLGFIASKRENRI